MYMVDFTLISRVKEQKVHLVKVLSYVRCGDMNGGLTVKYD